MTVEEEAVEAVSHLQKETNRSLTSSGDGIGEGICFNVHILSVHVFPVDKSDQNEESDEGTQTRPHMGKAGKSSCVQCLWCKL